MGSLDRIRPRSAKAETSNESPEQMLPSAECLIILGGGIDQVTLHAGEENEEKIWKSSRYVVETDQTIEQRDKRTGVRKPYDPAKSPRERLGKDLVVHAGNAHMLAAIEYIDEMRERGSMPKRIVFAAGRTRYISNVTDDPEVDEGLVMRKEFENRSKDKAFEGTEIEVRGAGGGTTAGDLLNGLKAVFDAHLASANVVLTEARMERTEAMYDRLKEKFPKLADIDVTFIAAEDLLRQRYRAGTAARESFEEMQRKLKGSQLWKETLRKESNGVRDLKNGSYPIQSQINDVDTTGL